MARGVLRQVGMTSADRGESRAAGPESPRPGWVGEDRCPGGPCGDDSCAEALAIDDALLDSVAGGTHAVEEPVGDDLDDEVERELAAVLITWQRSVRRQPESWSVDVDRAAVLVDRARSTPSATRRHRLRAPLVAAAVATLVAVTLWSTPGGSPQDADAWVLAASADLDQASAALERGDTTRARSALERADQRLLTADESRAARLLRERWREVHDQVDPETSAPDAPRSSERRAARNSTTSTTTSTEADRGRAAEAAEPSSAAQRPPAFQHRPDREETSGMAAPETGPDRTPTGTRPSDAPVPDTPDRSERNGSEGDRSERDRSEGDRSEGDGPERDHDDVSRSGPDADDVGDPVPGRVVEGAAAPGPRGEDRNGRDPESGLQQRRPDDREPRQDQDQQDHHDGEDDDHDEDDDEVDEDDEDEDD
ncbi:MAG: hypothetical protein K0S40_3338 [Actinomycetospora sp.]|nr:hypothetical protein [Actinomycetospora sp.]